MKPNLFGLILLMPAFLSGVIALYAWRRRSIPGATIIFFLMLGTSVAIFAYGMELMSLAFPDKLLWVRIRYMGTALIYPMILLLAFWYTNRRQWLTIRGVMLLLILPVFSLVALFTDNLHHLHYASLGLDTDGPFPMITATAGPLYWFYAIHSFVYNLLALVILLMAYFHASLVSRRQSAMLMIGTALPVLAGLLYMIGVRPFGGLNILSFAYAVSSLVFAWAIIDRQLLDLRPIARGMIFESMTDGFVVLNNQLSVVDANPAGVRLLNLTRDNIGQHGNKAFFDSPTLVCLIRNEPHSHIQIEIGEQLFDASRTSLFDDRQNLIGHLISLRDITGIKRSEEVLKESEKKYRFLADNMNDIVWIMDLKLQTVYVTPSIETVLGFTQEERMRQSVQEQLTPGSLSIAMEALAREQALEEQGQSDPGRKATLTLEFYHKDGSTRWLETIISGIRDDQDVLINLYGLSRDVSERIKTEGKLRESEERYRHVSSIISDVVYSCQTDEDGSFSIDWMTGAAERISGYSIEEIKLQKCWQFLVVEEDLPLFEENIAGLTPGTHGRCELRIRRKDGETAWIASYAECIEKPENPGCRYLYGGLIDITERKRTEAKIIKYSDDLTERIKELHCLYSVSEIVREEGMTEDRLLQNSVRMIAQAYLYPEITACRITWGDREYLTENFVKTAWLQSSAVRVHGHGEPVGQIEVCYLEERPKKDEGPFLAEERKLLNSVADLLGRSYERKQAEAQREKLIADLRQAMLEVRTLSGMLPICASCKKIRNDKGYWERIEQYIGDRSMVTFSHGICPECAQKLYPEMDQKK